MPLDPGIYQQADNIKSPEQYAAGAQQLENLRTQAAQNRLSLLLNQQKADQYTQQIDRMNQLRSIAQGWNQQTTDQQRVNDVRNAGLFEEADNLEKASMHVS
jgi:hypothetical protein